MASRGARSGTSPQKRAFARSLVETGSGLVAMKEAGYKTPTDTAAKALMRDPTVRMEMERIYTQTAGKGAPAIGITREYLLGCLKRTADITGQVYYSKATGALTQVDTGAHLRTVDMMGKTIGMWMSDKQGEVLTGLAELLAGVPPPDPEK